MGNAPDNDRYVPVRRPMMLDQVVDAEDEFGYGRTVEIIPGASLRSWSAPGSPCLSIPTEIITVPGSSA